MTKRIGLSLIAFTAAMIFSLSGANWSSISTTPSSPAETPMLPPWPSSIQTLLATFVVLICTAAQLGSCASAAALHAAASTPRRTFMTSPSPGRAEMLADAQLGAYDPGAFDHRRKLAAGHRPRQVLHAAVGRHDDALRGHHRERGANACRDLVCALDLVGTQVEHAQEYLLVPEAIQNGRIQPRLRCLDGDLVAAAARQLGQEGIARGLVGDHVRIPKAQVHDGRDADAGKRAVDRLDGEFARLVGMRLHVG